MTFTLFRRAAYGLMGLSLVSVLSVQWASKGTAAGIGPPAPAAAAPTPTASRYNCGDADNPDYITFDWTRPMPQGGWLGNVSYRGEYKIQVFDAKEVEPNVTDWTYQAQNGSFLCHMIVSNKPPLRNRYVSFERCNNQNWPQVVCYLR